MATAPKFDGVKIKLGGEDYIVPPLSLRQVKKFQAIIEEQMEQSIGAASDGPLNGDQVESMKTVILAALQRNYPELTEDWLEDNIDLGNLISVFVAAMGVNGLKKAAAELALPAG
jgi:hypothetical protein